MKKEPNKKLAGLFLIVGFTLFFALIGQTIWHKMMMDKEDIWISLAFPGMKELLNRKQLSF